MPLYATDRQASDAHHRLMLPNLGGGIISRSVYDIGNDV